jgi:hypothetical protein
MEKIACIIGRWWHIYLTMKTQVITTAELKDVLESLHSCGVTHAQIHIRTDAKLLRTGNPYGKGEVFKVSSFSVAIGKNYQNGVNRRLEKLGEAAEFVSGETWHEKHEGFNTLRQYKGDPTRLYAFLPVNTQNRPTTAFEDSHGNPIERAAIAAFLPKEYGSAKQAAAGLSIENQEKVRTVALANIVGLTVNHETHLIPRG